MNNNSPFTNVLWSLASTLLLLAAPYATAQEPRSQEEIEAQRNMAFAKLGQKIQTVLGESAQQNGYSAVLYLDSLAQSGLGGYFDPAYDITQDIIDRYNIKYPAAAAPATPGQ